MIYRSNFSPNQSTQVETRKASLSLAVDDLRVAVEKGNVAAVQKYLDDGECFWTVDSLSFLE